MARTVMAGFDPATLASAEIPADAKESLTSYDNGI